MKMIWMLTRAIALVAALSLVAPTAPSRAQFTDQSTWVAVPGGTANAITLAVSNWSRNLPGVPIHFLPTADNTTSVTVVVNGVGSPVAVLQKNNTALTALSGGELRAGQWATIGFDGTEWVLDDPLGKYTHASTLDNSALSFGYATNLQIVGSVSTNALTIALKTGSSGATSPADPTATAPILIPFRDSTIANGDPKVVPVIAPLSFTIASGSTMGCVSGQMCRLWVMAICSTGLECTGSAGSDVVSLCAINVKSGTNIAPINEAALQTSASGTSGGNSAQTYYCNVSAVTARAIRILGYIDIQETTAGTWAAGPTYVQLFGPGIKKPGEIVQMINTTTTTSGDTASSCPTMAALSPAVSVAITPTSAANVIRVSTSGSVADNTANSGMSIQLARSSTVIGIFNYAEVNAAWRGMPSTLTAYDSPNSTSSQTYQVFGCSTTGTGLYPTGNSSGDGASFEAWEIMGANDNVEGVPPLSKAA